MRAPERERRQLQAWAARHAFEPSSELPDAWPHSARLSKHGLRPLYHGDHAMGLSGAYAAINAIRLVLAAHRHWTDRDDRELLSAAWDWQLARGLVRTDRGTRWRDWQRLTECLTYTVTRRFGHSLEIMQLWPNTKPDPARVFHTIERLIVAQQAVLILFAGARYTVIRGFTPHSFLFFDSGGREWIKRSATSIPPSTVPASHKIVPSATMALRRRS